MQCLSWFTRYFCFVHLSFFSSPTHHPVTRHCWSSLLCSISSPWAVSSPTLWCMASWTSLVSGLDHDHDNSHKLRALSSTMSSSSNKTVEIWVRHDHDWQKIRAKLIYPCMNMNFYLLGTWTIYTQSWKAKYWLKSNDLYTSSSQLLLSTFTTHVLSKLIT